MRVDKLHDSSDALRTIYGKPPGYTFRQLRRQAASGANLADLKKALPPVDADAAPPTVSLLQESLGNLPVALALLGCFSALGIVVADWACMPRRRWCSRPAHERPAFALLLGRVRVRLAGRPVRSLRLALLALPVGALGAWLLGRNLSHWLYKWARRSAELPDSAAVLLVIGLQRVWGPR